MKEVTDWGLRIETSPAKETAKEALRYIDNGAMDIILYLTVPMLANAKDNEETRECLKAMDMMICAEPELLTSLNSAASEWVNEIEEDTFFHEMIKRIARAKQNVYLVADTNEALTAYEEYLRGIHENTVLAGAYLWNDSTGSADDLVNEINDSSPNVVISALDFERFMQLVSGNRQSLNADLWIARPDGTPGYDAPKGLAWLAQKLIYNKILNKD
ncbi:MAG: WecB/TagA/CpsF family glycosyltransferase [Lachnospiraceae bacterium]|nr:WecB/TagA/CpsF family glycosyltransferase [Lachnospiraceae bacterium]